MATIPSFRPEYTPVPSARGDRALKIARGKPPAFPDFFPPIPAGGPGAASPGPPPAGPARPRLTAPESHFQDLRGQGLFQGKGPALKTLQGTHGGPAAQPLARYPRRASGYRSRGSRPPSRKWCFPHGRDPEGGNRHGAGRFNHRLSLPGPTVERLPLVFQRRINRRGLGRDPQKAWQTSSRVARSGAGRSERVRTFPVMSWVSVVKPRIISAR